MKTNDNTERSPRHCQSCGHAVGSLDLFCPACGCALEDSRTSSAAETLANSLMAIDNQKEGLLRGLMVSLSNRNLEKATKKAQIIKTFPVPNTKKDLLELIHMCATNVDARIIAGRFENLAKTPDEIKVETLLSEAWMQKLESTYQKAKVLLQGDPDFPKIESIYTAKRDEIEALQQKPKRKMKLKWLAVIPAIGFVLFAVFGMSNMIKREKEEKYERNHSLEMLVLEIREDMSKGDYDDALLKTNYIRMKDGVSPEEEARWDREREGLIDEIEALRNPKQ